MTRLFRQFAQDRRGATVILFALTLIPILGAIAGAIDFGRALNGKVKVQGALDSALLAASTRHGSTDAERIAYAQKVFKTNLLDSQIARTAQASISISSDGVISGTASANLPSIFLGMFGIDELEFNVDSEVRIASKPEAEIALVLDYSGSMNGRGKYQAMRNAAIDLIDQLSEKGTNDKIKFGLVPFSGHVYGTLPSDYIVDETPGGTWTNCTHDRKWPYNIQDSTPLASNDDTKWGMTCTGRRCNAYGECSNYGRKNLVISPLTNNHSSTIAQLRRMSPLGWTHIALGLSFGWHLVSPNPPWTEGAAYGKKDLLKAIVLLTDGQQTSDAWGMGNSHSVRNGEENLEDLCRAIKDKDVLLVTVAFDLRDQDTKDRLRDCATSRQYFFDADSNAQLSDAFEAIAAQFIKHTHLSR